MFRAVIGEWNIGATGHWLAIQFSQSNAAADAERILHPDFISRRVITKADGVAGPVSRDAWIDREHRAVRAKPEHAFHAGAIEPGRRTRVPGPTPSSDVWRLGTHVTRNHVGRSEERRVGKSVDLGG